MEEIDKIDKCYFDGNAKKYLKSWMLEVGSELVSKCLNKIAMKMFSSD